VTFWYKLHEVDITLRIHQRPPLWMAVSGVSSRVVVGFRTRPSIWGESSIIRAKEMTDALHNDEEEYKAVSVGAVRWVADVGCCTQNCV